MDCFFASVARVKNPSLKGKCIAVCHGGGEISSCSYEARAYGVRAGMFFRNGKQLCPGLLSVPYDFDLYEEVSVSIYARFFRLGGVCVEAVSVDEAFLDVTNVVGDDREGSQTGAEALVLGLREGIYEDTGCTASAGIGGSKLVARLATMGAKPNGQLRVREGDEIRYLDTLKVKDLPGIGWRTERRLGEMGVVSCPQLRKVGLEVLQREFGERQGMVFYDLVRALDGRPVVPLKPRKSIGAEASWGVRFERGEGGKVRMFVRDMADEVAGRVEGVGATGGKVTYKVYRRRKEASMVGYKFLGHGPCTVLSRSVRLGGWGRGVLREVCWKLHEELGVKNEDLRGVGLQVSDLRFGLLRLDYMDAHTVADTKRIDSFFKTVGNEGSGKGGEGGRSGGDGNGRIEVLDEWGEEVGEEQERGLELDDETQSADVALERESEEEPGENSQEIEELGYESEDRIEPCPVENGGKAQAEAGYQSDEDKIEPGRAEDSVAKSSHQPAPNNVNIPSGWDPNVFHALPEELQLELLQENKATNARSINAGQDRAIVQREPEPRPNGRRKRKRSVNARQAALQEGTEKRQRSKQSAQVTMTQFADISELRAHGHEVLDANEFRQKPLRDCVELLEDLKGKRLQLHSRSKDQASVGKGIESKIVSIDKPVLGAESMGDDGLDIPSPPSLSSDSESEDDIANAVLAHGFGCPQIYEDEDLVEYAYKLNAWMIANAEEVKSAHVELLRGRVLELLRMKKLERLCAEMRLIRRYAAQLEESGWRNGFNALLEDVQNEAQHLYGFKLALKELGTYHEFESPSPS